MPPMTKEQKIEMRVTILECISTNSPMLGILMEYIDRPDENTEYMLNTEQDGSLVPDLSPKEKATFAKNCN